MMINKSEENKKDKNNSLKINLKSYRSLGFIVNLLILLIGIYFRLLDIECYSVTLGDKGSIVVSLLKSFSLTSGRSLIYLSVYGLILTFVNKEDSLKEFYNYYMVAVSLIAIGSIIYFVV